MPDIHSLPSVTSAPLPSQPPTPLPPTPLPPTPLQSSQPSAPPLSSLKSPSIPVPAQSLPSFRHPSASGIGHHPGVHQGAWGAAEGSVGEPSSRALRLGVCGPVGTGKSSLIALLCAELSETLRMAVVTNDIYTDEDARFLRSAGVLDPERILAVETGACPHTAIRDDITANLMAVEDLEERFAPLDVVLVESGGDNLTATFSPALVDTQIFIIDVAGGGDVARKGGPGITRADLLIVNKTDLAPHVGVDPVAMVSDAAATRDGRPVIALSRHDRASVRELTDWVLARVREHREGNLVPADPGPMAPHSHGAGPVHVHEPARLGGPGRVDYEHSSAHVHAHVQADVHADVPGRHVTDAESARVEHDHSSADVHADVPGRHVTDAESARVDNRSAHAPGAAPVPAPL